VVPCNCIRVQSASPRVFSLSCSRSPTLQRIGYFDHGSSDTRNYQPFQSERSSSAQEPNRHWTNQTCLQHEECYTTETIHTKVFCSTSRWIYMSMLLRLGGVSMVCTATGILDFCMNNNSRERAWHTFNLGNRDCTTQYHSEVLKQDEHSIPRAYIWDMYSTYLFTLTASQLLRCQ
jgi:hypothetical protein